MPFLFWLPMIIMSGLWSVAEENAGALRKLAAPDPCQTKTPARAGVSLASLPFRYSQYLHGGKSRL